jgi:hypothetical protein
MQRGKNLSNIVHAIRVKKSRCYDMFFARAKRVRKTYYTYYNNDSSSPCTGYIENPVLYFFMLLRGMSFGKFNRYILVLSLSCLNIPPTLLPSSEKSKLATGVPVSIVDQVSPSS